MSNQDVNYKHINLGLRVGGKVGNETYAFKLISATPYKKIRHWNEVNYNINYKHLFIKSIINT
jgi:hypothetical protein